MTSGGPTPEQRASASEPTPPSPHAILGWLRSLSIDVLAAAILDADGTVLAGDAGLAHAADSPESGLVRTRSERHTVVVRAGPKALQRLVRTDVQAALDALEGR
jgi:hypothetical protein